MLNHIKIVLVQPSHPGNIGAVARVMKNMGLNKLCLIDPKCFPHEESWRLAGRASDILDSAMCYPSLEDALISTQLIIGTSARDRSLDWPILDASEAAHKCVYESLVETAFIFGPERTGLINKDLQQCHFHLLIPTHPSYPSLNLASAVQIVCYELYRHYNQLNQNCPSLVTNTTTNAELNGFYQHLQEILVATNFLDPNQPKQLMPKLQRLFNKAQLTSEEVNILRGFLSSIKNKIR